MARAPRPCCYDSFGVTELSGEGDDGRIPADESCQIALTMTEMQADNTLAQQAYPERYNQHRREAPPCVNESERSASNSVNGAAILPPARIPPCHNGPAKLKWNSDVRCTWPPSSPPRARGGSGVVSGRGVITSEARTKNVAVMTLPAIDAEELIEKVEALELELGVHVGNERQLLDVNEQLRKRLEGCMRELHDAAVMSVQLDVLSHEMEKILKLLRCLSLRNAALEKEKAQVQAKLEREAARNRFQARKIQIERHVVDLDVDLCDAQCQTICTFEQVDTRKRSRERKRSLEGETPDSNQLQSRSLSPAQSKNAYIVTEC